MTLHAAAAANNLASTQRLLVLGTHPDTLDARGWSPLALAARHASDWRILSRLALAGANPHRRIADDPSNPSPLHIAALYRNIPALRHLIILITADAKGQGAYLDPTYVLQTSPPIAGVTPLLLAAWVNNDEAVMDLLRAGANAAATDAYGCGFFHYAAAGHPPAPSGGGMAAAARVAAALGADVGGRLGREFGNCTSLPIHFAAFFRNIEILKVLLRCGADAMVKDSRGCTPLTLFCCGNVPGAAPRPISSPRDAALVAMMVAAGDHNWEALPTPCLGLEAALPAVWKAVPEDVPQLFQRLTEGAQRRIQETLQALHRHLPAPGYAELRADILNMVLTDEDVEVGEA